MQKIATIDLGTNSIHLLISEIYQDGHARVLFDQSKVVRLGQGLKQTGQIHPDAIKRCTDTLASYKTIIQDHQCKNVYMTATCAMREASNASSVKSILENIIQTPIEIIAKEEEARLSYISVTYDVASSDRCLVTDIGGGSTEIAYGQGQRFEKGQSTSIGTVKLFEGTLWEDRPSQKNMDQTTLEIKQHLSELVVPKDIQTFYATAGTFTLLASLACKLATYTPLSIENFLLTQPHIEQLIENLRQLSLAEKKSLPGMMPERADVALPGALIALCLCDHLNTSRFIIRDRGIRFGKMMDVVGKITHLSL